MSTLSFKLQLAIGAVVLSVVLLLVQSAGQFYTLRGELARRIQVNQFNLVSEVVVNLDEKLEERKAALVRAGRMVPLGALSDSAALERQLRKESALLSLFDDLYIFDANGVLLADWPAKPGRRKLDMSSRDYIQAVRRSGQPTISQPILGKSTRQPIIVVAAPVLDKAGRLAAIIGGVLNLSQPNLLGRLPQRRAGDTGYFYLTAADRTLIAHPDWRQILQPVAAPGEDPLLDKALGGWEGTMEGTNSHGLRGLFTFKRLQSTGWILVSVIPVEEAFRPIKVIREQMVLVTLALGIIFTPLLWLFARRLVRPLGQLADALRQRASSIRPGIAAPPVAVEGSTEVRTVAQAFNDFLLARNEAEQRQQLAARVLETTVEAVIVTDANAQVVAVNPAFCRITGYTDTEIHGRHLALLYCERHPQAFYDQLWNTVAEKGEWSGELWSRRKNGEVYPKRQTISSMRDPDGKVTNYVLVFEDLSEIRNAEQAAEHLARHDTLTGLANRPLFLQQLEKTLNEARLAGMFTYVLLLDLDRFKVINDARGLGVGDRLLRTVAQRLGHVLAPEDTLARLDADEFAIVSSRQEASREKAGRAAMELADKVHDVIEQSVELDGERFHLTVSIGIALLPESAQETSSDALRQADTAVHRAKAEGGARHVFFEQAMGEAVRQHYQVEQELRTAALASQLRLYLQPQVDGQGRDVGAEALVRWQHPERGMVLPGGFIPVAEMSDLIVAVDRWMLTEVCKLLAQTGRDGMALRIAVNVSARHFERDDFVGEVRRVLRATGADPKRLTLEVTESLLIEDMANTIVKMQELTTLGIHFSLDDFGTGYSSLSNLKRLPIHELKIDRSFIQDAPQNASDAALVDTILSVAKHLHLDVVAEGVETQAHMDFLNSRGTVIHQGYLCGRPMPVADWLARIAARRAHAEA